MSLAWYHYLQQPDELLYLLRSRERIWLPTCPCCKGAGGEVEPVLDYSQGPYYECDFCQGEGVVSWWLWAKWCWWNRKFWLQLGVA